VRGEQQPWVRPLLTAETTQSQYTSMKTVRSLLMFLIATDTVLGPLVSTPSLSWVQLDMPGSTEANTYMRAWQIAIGRTEAVGNDRFLTTWRPLATAWQAPALRVATQGSDPAENSGCFGLPLSPRITLGR
jgi:hypothetical protein